MFHYHDGITTVGMSVVANAFTVWWQGCLSLFSAWPSVCPSRLRHRKIGLTLAEPFGKQQVRNWLWVPFSSCLWTMEPYSSRLESRWMKGWKQKQFQQPSACREPFTSKKTAPGPGNRIRKMAPYHWFLHWRGNAFPLNNREPFHHRLQASTPGRAQRSMPPKSVPGSCLRALPQQLRV